MQNETYTHKDTNTGTWYSHSDIYRHTPPHTLVCHINMTHIEDTLTHSVTYSNSHGATHSFTLPTNYTFTWSHAWRYMFPQLFTHTFTTLPVHHHTRSLSHPWSHVQAWAASRIHDLTNTHTSTSAHRLHLHRDTHSHGLDSSPQAVSLLSLPSMQVTTSSPIVEPFSDSP